MGKSSKLPAKTMEPLVTPDKDQLNTDIGIIHIQAEFNLKGTF